MIVETDFLDHWKTQTLIRVLNDPLAPCYLLRLWAHCQQRKEYRFDSAKLSPMILRGITRAQPGEQALWTAFVEAGFLDLHEDGTIEVHGFHDANSQLCANWENGKKGGRPGKNAAPSGKPIHNPTETHPEPIEEREEREETEKVEKQDGGEEREEASEPFSPPPGNKPFWYGTKYGGHRPEPVETYEDLHAMDDPILAAMAVVGDHAKALYGFMVKGCNRCQKAGLHPESIRKFLFNEVERILGEIKTGERRRGMDAAKTFVARLSEYFETIDKPKHASDLRKLAQGTGKVAP